MPSCLLQPVGRALLLLASDPSTHLPTHDHRSPPGDTQEDSSAAAHAFWKTPRQRFEKANVALQDQHEFASGVGWAVPGGGRGQGRGRSGCSRLGPPAPPAPGTKGRLCPSPAAPARGNPPLKPAQAPCPGPRHAAARANVLSEPEGAFRAGGQGRGGAAPPPHSAGGEPRGPGNHRAAPLRRPPLPGPTARPHGEGGGGGGGGGGGRAVS